MEFVLLETQSVLICILKALRSEQKYAIQYKETISKPVGDSLITYTPKEQSSTSKPKYAKRQQKSLISISNRPYNSATTLNYENGHSDTSVVETPFRYQQKQRTNAK